MIKTTKIMTILALTISGCGGGGGDNSQTVTSADINYSNVVPLDANVNKANALDAGPQISPNGLELYFFSDRPGGIGGMDLYRSTRASTSANWEAATNLGATINSSDNDRNISLINNGLVMYFTSSRSGGSGDDDIYMSSRTALNADWEAPVNLGIVVNTQFSEGGVSVSGDNLSLYFHSNRPGGFGNNDLYVSTRVIDTDPWSPPVNLGASVNSADFENAPAIASDGLSLYFHSTRTGGPGAIDIWKTTRTSTTEAWTSATVMPTPINSISGDLQPGLSNDWQELYFASDSGGNRDIWIATP